MSHQTITEVPPPINSTSGVAPSVEGSPQGGKHKPLSLTVAASGDILPHTSVINSAANYAAQSGKTGYDFTPMFAEVAHILQKADLSLCHLEVPLSPDDSAIDGGAQMIFNAPRDLAFSLKKAGYQGCDFASNHTIDQGLPGIAATETIMQEAGLGLAGPTMDPHRAGKATIYEVKGAKVAHLAYTYTYPNSWGSTTDIPESAPWLKENSWPVLQAQGILKQAQEAKNEGADFVIVSAHWGTELEAAPTEEQRAIATELLNSDAVDLILGTHAHVGQPCERINDKQVVYGMGNQVSHQSPLTHPSLTPATQDGMTVTATLNRDGDGKISTELIYQPTHVDLNGHVIRAITPESNPDSWQRTTSTMDMLGGCQAQPKVD